MDDCRLDCPTVPVTLVTAMLKFCHFHQAWSVSVWRSDDDGDRDVPASYSEVCCLGPLYTTDQAVQLLGEMISAALTSPASPWVP